MPQPDMSTLIAFLGLSISVMNFLVLRHDRRFKELEEMRTRLTRMETKVEIFWDTMRIKIVDLVKAPTHERMDELLDKFKAKAIRPEELIELKEHLLQREREISDNAQKLILTFTIMCIDFFMSNLEEN